MTDETMDRIRAQRWFYRFELPDGQVTETYAGDEALRFHADRLRMLDSALNESFPDSLSRKTALDLACHQGFYSLHLAKRGLRRVLGVDVRREHVESANLIKSVHDLDQLEFRRGDVNESAPEDFEPADVVLLFGLIYHLEDPIRILRLARRWTRGVCLIETQIAAPLQKTITWGAGTATKEMRGYFAVIDECAEARNHNLETGVSGVCLCPSLEALLWILRTIGFRQVDVVPPHAGASEAFVKGTRLMVKASV